MLVERGARAVLTCGLAVAAACDRGHHESPAPAPPIPPAPAASASPAPTSGCALAPIPLRLPAGKRIVPIGDLHGDLGGTRAALKAAGAIDDHDQWIGGDLVLVQTGDILPRRDDASAILELFQRLAHDATA